MPRLQSNLIFSVLPLFLISFLLSSFSIANAQQAAGTAGVTFLPGVIPAADEAHASKEIGICGTKHFEPRLELCDKRDNRVYRYVKIGSQS